MSEISIIIPVYNASHYLPECLDSILSQTFTDFEVICINDGSTDNSLDILTQYEKKNFKFVIINQQNQGVSAARNTGLSVAEGKFIAFVDADDTIAPDFAQNLFSAAQRNEVDIVFSNSLSGYSLNHKDQIYNRTEILRDILPVYFKADLYNSACNKLYNANIIRDNHIKFPTGKTHAEDAEFNIRFLMHAQQLYMLDYSGYHYRETPNSATRSPENHQYLHQAVDHFHRNWTPVIGDLIDQQQMHDLKKERLINNVISQIYIYGNPGNGLNLRSRWKKLSEIVSHPVVIKVFREDNSRITPGFSRYKKRIFMGILRQSVIRLYLLTQYSYYRNR